MGGCLLLVLSLVLFGVGGCGGVTGREDVTTTAAPSIGAAAEVIDEVGCWDTEFRLTCRDLDWTIAIIEARFLPLSEDNSSSSSGPPCVASHLEQPWARAVSPDGPAVIPDPADNETYPWPLRPDPSRHHFRLAINKRCSGVNHCSFSLARDESELGVAGSFWGPGTVAIRYACMRKHKELLRFCNREVTAGAAPSDGETTNYQQADGFVASPGYPNLYVLDGSCAWIVRPRLQGQRVAVTLLDVSLRGVGPHEIVCSDWLQVSALRADGDERVLLAGCGEAPEAVRIESPPGALALRLAIRSSSHKALYSRRGVLFHYKVVGCGWPPPNAPKDSYEVTSNATTVLYMCCVGFKFPDSGVRQRELRCDEQRGLWHVPSGDTKALLPDCIRDGEGSVSVKGNLTKDSWTVLSPENSKSSVKLKMKKEWMETDLLFDILIPTIIIGVLLFGNGIIIFIIFQIKKRKLATELQEEEEMQVAQNGTETIRPVKPSEV